MAPPGNRTGHPYTHNAQRRKIMGTTPYEQRFNYYLAARDQLTNAYHAEFNEVQCRKEYGLGNKEIPEYPTAQQIFSLAEEIKAFAEKK